jgi:hypothetical protein
MLAAAHPRAPDGPTPRARHRARARHRPLARPPLTLAPPACTRSVRPPPVRPSHAPALARCAPNRLLPARLFAPRSFTRPTPVWARLVGARASAIHALAVAYAPARCAPTRIVLARHLRARAFIHALAPARRAPAYQSCSRAPLLRHARAPALASGPVPTAHPVLTGTPLSSLAPSRPPPLLWCAMPPSMPAPRAPLPPPPTLVRAASASRAPVPGFARGGTSAKALRRRARSAPVDVYALCLLPELRGCFRRVGYLPWIAEIMPLRASARLAVLAAEFVPAATPHVAPRLAQSPVSSLGRLRHRSAADEEDDDDRDDDDDTSLAPSLTRTVSDVSSAHVCTPPNSLSRAGSLASASSATTRGADGAPGPALPRAPSSRAPPSACSAYCVR